MTLLQRAQQPIAACDPTRQGRAFDLDPLPVEHLALAIQRLMVAELAHQYMREQRGSR
jgi:hypothetical protein